MEKELEKRLTSIESNLKDLVQTVCVDALGRLKTLQQEKDLLEKELNEFQNGKDYKTTVKAYQESFIRKNEEIKALKEEILNLKRRNNDGINLHIQELLRVRNEKDKEIEALKMEIEDLKKRESTIQVLSERLHSMKEEVRELKKENAALKEEKTNSEKVILLMKQVEELKKENSILKDILNDPEK